MEKIGLIFYRFCIDPVIQLLLFLLPLIVLSLLVSFFKLKVEKVFLTYFGKIPYYCFAAIGTPVHEASHLVACFAFRHRIKRFSLFFPGPNGRLGYVEHSFDPGSAYQRLGCLFIGISPLIGGIAALILLTYLFLPAGTLLTAIHFPKLSTDLYAYFWMFKKAVLGVLLGLWRAFSGREWAGCLYGILAFGIGSHMIPSSADWKVGGWGFGVFYGAICLFSFLLHLMGRNLEVFLGSLTRFLALPVQILTLTATLLFIVWICGSVFGWAKGAIYRS